jgi:hypothetical protein
MDIAFARILLRKKSDNLMAKSAAKNVACSI